jgi:hypothetical protein
VTGALLFSNDSLSLFFFFFSVKRPVAGKIISLNLFSFNSDLFVCPGLRCPGREEKLGKLEKIKFSITPRGICWIVYTRK